MTVFRCDGFQEQSWILMIKNLILPSNLTFVLKLYLGWHIGKCKLKNIKLLENYLKIITPGPSL